MTEICVGTEAASEDDGRYAEACRWLGRARIELGAGRWPEAAAFAQRAVRAGTDAAHPVETSTQRGELCDAARLVHAEALGRGSRTAPALEILGALSASASPALRAAAGLRAADLLLEAARVDEAHATYQRWLSAISDDEPDASERLLRAADAAQAAGDAAAAGRMLTRAGARAPEESPIALRVAMRAALLESPADSQAAVLKRALASQDVDTAREARALQIRALLQGDPDRAALERMAALQREGVPPSLGPSLRVALRRVVDHWISETGSDERCERLLRTAGTLAADLVRWAQRPAALEAVARCSERLGLAQRAARLRAVLARDLAVAPPRATSAPPARTAASLDAGAARAASAYAAGDFVRARAMPPGDPWRTLADAGETARRARAALAD